MDYHAGMSMFRFSKDRTKILLGKCDAATYNKLETRLVAGVPSNPSLGIDKPVKCLPYLQVDKEISGVCSCNSYKGEDNLQAP